MLHKAENGSPSLLISFYYLKGFLENRHKYAIRDWVLDSGAFSAHNSGVEIDLDEYMATCKDLMQSDDQLMEIFSLDVIGDWQASLKNTEKMWAKGIEAIPCYHIGEPESVLIGMAKDYPKIALGGVAAKTGHEKLKWAEQCFARVWPTKIHGFAFGGERAIMRLPFHSVDATNWEISTCKYGSWRAYGNKQLSIKGSKQNLQAEIEWYLKLERTARQRWRKEMALLESLDKPDVRLAWQAHAGDATRFRSLEKDSS